MYISCYGLILKIWRWFLLFVIIIDIGVSVILINGVLVIDWYSV